MPRPISFGFYAGVRDDPHFVRVRASGYAHDQILPTAVLIKALADNYRRRSCPSNRSLT